MSWRRRMLAVSAAAVTFGAVVATIDSSSATAAGPPSLGGFTPAHSATERAAESAFQQVPSVAVAQQLDHYLSLKTGLIGTSGDWRRVQYVAAKLRSYGLTPHIRTYYPYISVPRSIRVTEISPWKHVLPNKENCYSFETDCPDVVVGYNALSPAGNVTAPIVYVNYGTVSDYAALAQAGISVRGKIVLARYGGVFRGVKTNLAAEHGAIGAVLYSDPADDGYKQGPVYPTGPWRNSNGIQRGSVQQLWQYGGDPLTPGYAATKNAKRIDPAKSNIAKIPTVPISYGAAAPLLRALGGPAVSSSFQGGLPFTYHYGPGPTSVNLDLKIDYKITPEWDVTATIPGRSQPDQTVYVGGHRDTWTYGSDDNLSGAENVLQIARGLAQLTKTGWRPERSITLATWDGEEYGLFGSTEYAEDLGADRLKNAVAYLNMDVAAGKYFGATGVPSLDQLVLDTTRQVHWPHTSGSIYDAWGGGKRPVVERLGSGSDYAAFIDHFGVPAMDIGAASDTGDYHCACDNYYMETHFVDPGWQYHVAMSQEVGLVTMRLADADVLPFGYATYAHQVGTYLKGFQAEQSSVDVSADITAAAAWEQAATAAQARAAHLLADGGSAAQFRTISRLLDADERQLLTARGLPTRPWFEHQIYAPGINSGYGTRLLPGLRDALYLEHDVAQSQSYADELHTSLVNATRLLRQAAT